MHEGSNIETLFQRQGSRLAGLRAESARERIKRIWMIRRYILDKENEAKLCEAMMADLRKSHAEVITTEIGPVLMAMNHIKAHLRSWMLEKWVPSPLSMAGLSSKVLYQPKGRCLIISPWNYPFQLSLIPLMHAIAAGNAVILKPSEVSPRVSDFLADMIADLFDSSAVAVVKGDVEVATELLSLPFNHIFFTGSPGVGKIVMTAAAKHLSSVTLELGGKSPVVVDASVIAKKVGVQTAWAKCLNSGQTCIAPDYGVVQEAKLEGFVEGFRRGVVKMYGNEPKTSMDFGRMVSEKHFHRVRRLVEDAVEKGAVVEVGGEMDESDLYIAPTLLTGVTDDMEVMQEEIFGPVLPVVSYKEIEEVTEIVGKRPQPLAFYIISNRKRTVERLLAQTTSGGVVLNDFMVGTINPSLPFGGINHSGIGKSNGHHGFIEFSNERGIVTRKWGTLAFVRPPFSTRMTNFLKFLFKHF